MFLFLTLYLLVLCQYIRMTYACYDNLQLRKSECISFNKMKTNYKLTFFRMVNQCKILCFRDQQFCQVILAIFPSISVPGNLIPLSY